MGLKIEITEIKRISEESKNLKGELTSNFKSMSSLLEEICANINSSELTGVNKNLVQAITNISEKVEKNLPEIINFLDKQIVNYEQTNTETKAAIDALAASANDSLQ